MEFNGLVPKTSTEGMKFLTSKPAHERQALSTKLQFCPGFRVALAREYLSENRLSAYSIKKLSQFGFVKENKTAGS